MPSFRRRASVIPTDHVEEPPTEAEPTADAANALALAEEAEAEAAEAEAAAAAARARARAIRLRREAQQAASASTTADKAEVPAAATITEPEPAREPDVDDETVVTTEDAPASDDAGLDEATSEEPKRARLRWLRRISWKGVAVGLALLCIGALVTASGYMVWQHRLVEREQQQTAEYSAAARQGVVTLMSLDFNKAKDDVQRIIDNTTGQFKEDFQSQAETFAQVAQDSKVITEVTVNATAVKEMTETTAQVLVSATSHVTNAAGAKQEPRTWRLMVDLAREGDQIKMAKVEFVP